MYEGVNPGGGPKLVAFAKRAKNAGWFVRISEFNGDLYTDRIYIDDDRCEKTRGSKLLTGL
jgi:hypothetical protein